MLGLRRLGALLVLSVACGGGGGGDGSAGSPCSVTSDCLAGLFCADGTCQRRDFDAGNVDSGGFDAARPDTGPVCPPANRCADLCCAESEECVDGSSCLPICESALRCGPDHTCCGDGEFCIADACVAPGDPCTDPIDCPEDAICDPELGRCLPRGDARCEYFPPAGVFEPAEEWHWSGSDIEPTFVHVMMTPVVGDVTGDGVPEVVFMTYAAGSSYGGRGVLRIVRGDTGEEVHSITDPVLCGDSGIALGDLDGDGAAEILAGGPCGAGQIHAFAADGTLRWRSVDDAGNPWTIGLDFGAISIADLEGDGQAEVVVGGSVLESDGTLRFAGRNTGFNCCGATPRAMLTTAYDMAGDGTLEIVGANGVWNADGSPVWDDPTKPEGFLAVADFFEDGQPDIVVVHNGSVSILRGDTGESIFGPITQPGGGRGGPPTVADFDGDGLPEIGIAGAASYSVFNPDFDADAGETAVLWSQTTQDTSSNITGSSVFDFDGDGRAEVVYNDECYMRIYSGTDGTVIREVAQHSHTLVEYPVIADIDADGNAEIVFAANAVVARCAAIAGYEGNLAGVRAFGDALDNWVGTRPVWNQHAYSITHIRADLSVPSATVPNHERFNNFRQNPQSFDAPNLQGALEVAGTSCSPELVLQATVTNRGAVTVGANLPVSFYAGSPAAPGRLFGTVRTTRAIPPGSSELVELRFDVLPEERGVDVPYFVRVDDVGDGSGEHNECIEDDNEAEAVFRCSGIE